MNSLHHGKINSEKWKNVVTVSDILGLGICSFSSPSFIARGPVELQNVGVANLGPEQKSSD